MRHSDPKITLHYYHMNDTWLLNQYDKIYGDWPNDYNEVVLVVNENNELDDLTLYALGLLPKQEIDKIK